MGGKIISVPIIETCSKIPQDFLDTILHRLKNAEDTKRVKKTSFFLDETDKPRL